MQLRLWVAEELLLQVVWSAVILVDNSFGIVFQQSMNPTSKLHGGFRIGSKLEVRLFQFDSPILTVKSEHGSERIGIMLEKRDACVCCGWKGDIP